MMNDEALTKEILRCVGTAENVASAMNCMTRIRIRVKDSQAVDRPALEAIPGVLQVIGGREGYLEVVVGPGHSSRCGEALRALGVPAAGQEGTGGPGQGMASPQTDWRAN